MKSGIFKEVIYLGPDSKGKGGISTVLAQYSEVIHPFRRGSVNSSRGKVRGVMNLGITMLKLLGYRMTGSRLLHIHYAGRGSWKRENMLAACGRLLGYRTLMHCHCNISELTEHQGLEAVSGKLAKADANIVLARSYKDFAEQKLKLKNVNVVPNFVQSPAVTVPEKHEGETTFLYLGLLNEAKGFFDLLEACAELSRRGECFKLIVGGVKNEDKVRSFISRNKLEDIVELRGWISGEKKEQAFREADVLVLPSYSEGMPMVIIEALQRGIAVIGTEVGAVPDMVDKGVNGEVIAPGDVAALTSAMKELIDDPARLAAYRKAALSKGQEYTAGKVLPMLQEIYRKTLDSHR